MRSTSVVPFCIQRSHIPHYSCLVSSNTTTDFLKDDPQSRDSKGPKATDAKCVFGLWVPKLEFAGDPDILRYATRKEQADYLARSVTESNVYINWIASEDISEKHIKKDLKKANDNFYSSKNFENLDNIPNIGIISKWTRK
ncbi:hypothetical protein TNCV_721981 [Trichonephila clavipes]|nr:hypothetical protein TNCV_721981 [Trichonephila clavipes]